MKITLRMDEEIVKKVRKIAIEKNTTLRKRVAISVPEHGRERNCMTGLVAIVVDRDSPPTHTLIYSADKSKSVKAAELSWDLRRRPSSACPLGGLSG